MAGAGIPPGVVVITGASSGIGRATAEAFAAEGADLVLAARGEAALEEVAAACRRQGARAIALPTDVTDIEAVRRLADRALEHFGRIDAWVSNVGVGAVGLFHETPMRDHARIVETDLIGHMNDAHAVVPIFLRQGRGVFVNMISLGGFVAMPYAAAYSAAKFGLRGFSEALRAELSGHRHIHVCDVYPAFIDTPGIAHAANRVGVRLSAPPPVADARRVAAAIVSAVHRPRPTIQVGAMTPIARVMHAIAPRLEARAMRRLMEGYFRRAERTERSEGNLYAPPSVAGGIDGGLRSPAQREMALVLGGLVTLGALLLATRRTGAAARR